MKVVFAGNQNCGKTTLFNLLTNNNAKVGNFPGITVDIAKGKMGNIEIYDLPGIYSLNTVSSEEFIAANAISELKPDKIVNVIDATSLRRGLYLTMQLKELGVPMIAVLNMMDEEKRKGSIDIKLLSKKLGIPVVGISAKKKYNIPEMISLLKAPPSRVEPFRIPASSLKERTEYIYGEIDKICN